MSKSIIPCQGTALAVEPFRRKQANIGCSFMGSISLCVQRQRSPSRHLWRVGVQRLVGTLFRLFADSCGCISFMLRLRPDEYPQKPPIQTAAWNMENPCCHARIPRIQSGFQDPASIAAHPEVRARPQVGNAQDFHCDSEAASLTPVE